MQPRQILIIEGDYRNMMFYVPGNDDISDGNEEGDNYFAIISTFKSRDTHI